MGMPHLEKIPYRGERRFPFSGWLPFESKISDARTLAFWLSAAAGFSSRQRVSPHPSARILDAPVAGLARLCASASLQSPPAPRGNGQSRQAEAFISNATDHHLSKPKAVLPLPLPEIHTITAALCMI
jgi:hypothetical protein